MVPSITDIFVYGDSFQSVLIGIINPDPKILENWAKEKGIEGELADWCANEEIRKMIMAEIGNQQIVAIVFSKKSCFSLKKIRIFFVPKKTGFF